MPNEVDDFNRFRAELNEEILNCGHLGIKRFFSLDHQAYEAGALDVRTKELLGLVASTVLRCDDCITYHLVRCGEIGWKRDEVIDALNVARGRRLHRHPPRPPGLCQNEGDTRASA